MWDAHSIGTAWCRATFGYEISLLGQSTRSEIADHPREQYSWWCGRGPLHPIPFLTTAHSYTWIQDVWARAVLFHWRTSRTQHRHQMFVFLFLEKSQNLFIFPPALFLFCRPSPVPRYPAQLFSSSQVRVLENGYLLIWSPYYLCGLAWLYVPHSPLQQWQTPYVIPTAIILSSRCPFVDLSWGSSGDLSID